LSIVRWEISIQPVAAKLRSETGLEKFWFWLFGGSNSFLAVAGSGTPASST
jgi:hypothetical protein